MKTNITMSSLKFLRNVELKPEEILFVESDINYSRIFLCSGRQIIIAKTLKQITEIVKGTSIVRVNRQVMLNACYIKYLSNNGFPQTAELMDGKTIAFSRRRTLEVQYHLKKYSIKTL